MNYFKEITNDDFIKFFIDELYTKTEFIQENDPNDFFDPEQEYGKHIEESQEKLYAFILKTIEDSGKILNSIEATNALNEKWKELIKILNPKIDEYIKKVKVDYR